MIERGNLSHKGVKLRVLIGLAREKLLEELAGLVRHSVEELRKPPRAGRIFPRESW